MYAILEEKQLCILVAQYGLQTLLTSAMMLDTAFIRYRVQRGLYTDLGKTSQTLILLMCSCSNQKKQPNISYINFTTLHRLYIISGLAISYHMCHFCPYIDYTVERRCDQRKRKISYMAILMDQKMAPGEQPDVRSQYSSTVSYFIGHSREFLILEMAEIQCGRAQN